VSIPRKTLRTYLRTIYVSMTIFLFPFIDYYRTYTYIYAIDSSPRD
jgi:hypothetical protein